MIIIMPSSLSFPSFLLLLLLLLLLLSYTSLSYAYPYTAADYNYSLNIDCGATQNSTDGVNTRWLSDRYFSGGETSIVSEPLRFMHEHEKTIRYFPISYGKKNCYSLPVPHQGRFLLRTFTVYDNFNAKSHSPSFDVSVSGTVVFTWRSPWPESFSRTGAYADLFVSPDGSSQLDVCFYSIATDSPLVASLQLFQTTPDAYVIPNAPVFNSSILVNYGRFSACLDQWGAGFSNDTDRFGRSWQPEASYRSTKQAMLSTESTIQLVSALKKVANVDQPPNYFPPKLYESVVTVVGEESFGYELQVDGKLDYLLWFHFAEVDVNVTRAGQRVFDVTVNGENVSRVDVFKAVGGFAAYDFSYVVKNLSTTLLDVRLSPVVGAPIICGLENYAIVPPDLRTVPDQVMAMKALKESLRVPARMGWNGDPCSPASWDAWEGVTCSLDKAEKSIVISQIELGSQGLKGYISDKITLLTNLVSLNLSSNSLQGTLPSGLGQKSLVKLDLSNNKFIGSIPDSLTATSLELVLLQNNALEGLVPDELYSVGLHGGTIDLSGNKGLCGVPSLPNCPLLWGKHGLSTGGKVAIALSCIFVFCLVIFGVHIYIKKRENDYDFGLPHEITALAAKRNRYHRQKSLMALEMESQHAKGFIPSYNSK